MRFLIALFAVTTLAYAQPDSLHVIWDKRGNGEQSHFGGQVWGLGDQNDDGYADFAVLSSGTGTPGQESEARFDLFYGGNPPETIPYLTYKGRPSPYRELWGAQTIGDMNGDGYIDWWIQYGFGAQDDSIVAEFHWGGSAADTIPDFIFGFSADQGYSWINGLGDFNGDGLDDFYFYDGGVGLSTDVTYVYFGGSPPDAIPDFVMHSNPIGSQNALPQAFGDLNGDHYTDFLTMTNYTQATTYIYLGGNPPSQVPSQTLSNFEPYPLTMQPDLNGDRRADLVVSRGGVQRDYLDVYLGRDTLSSVYDYRLNFDGCENMAFFLCSVGDINHDGYDDVAAISDGCNLGFGGLRLYLGHPWLNPDPVISIDGGEAPLDLVGIRRAAGLGDVDGDGVQDWSVGATNDMTYGQGRRGRVVILRGDTTLRVDAREPRASFPRSLDVTVFPNPFNGEATILLNVPLFAPQVRLTLYNLLGQTVHEATLNGITGEVRYPLCLPALPSGLYLLKTQAGQLINTQKVMLLR